MKEITIVCVAYQRYRKLEVLIHAFLAQTIQNFKLLILHDGPDEPMAQMLAGYKAKYPDEINYGFSAQRHNDFGHSLRDLGISMLDTEYVLITNDDNYYCPKFLETMFDAIHANRPDIVMCDMLHSHHNPGGRPQVPYRYFETRPQRLSVDIGCFITTSALAKSAGFRDKTHDGDATYFEDIVKNAGTAKIIKIDQALFVHN